MKILTKGQILASALIAVVVLAAPARAEDLQPMKEGEVAFVSGGIGLDERTELLARQKNYDLSIWSVNKIRKLVMPSMLVVDDKDGKELLSLNDSGPLFLLQLPKGDYTIRATYNDKEEQQKVSIQNGRKTVAFVWDDGMKLGSHKAAKEHAVKHEMKKSEPAEAKPVAEKKAKAHVEKAKKEAKPDKAKAEKSGKAAPKEEKVKEAAPEKDTTVKEPEKKKDEAPAKESVKEPERKMEKTEPTILDDDKAAKQPLFVPPIEKP
jgi:hypothetical protein